MFKRKGLKNAQWYGFFLLAFIFISCKDQEEKIKPQYKTLTESVYASFSLTPDSLYQVYSTVSGIIERVYPQEGDVLKSGDSLFKITNDVPALNAENARLAFQLAKENYEGRSTLLQSIEDRMAMVALRFRQDSIDYMRQKRLWTENIGTRTEYEHRQEAYELSKQELIAVTNELERTRVELKNKLLQSQNNYRNALSNASDYLVTSKINGKVYDVFKEVGELVNQQEPLATIGSANYFLIEMEVDEVDISRIVIGQQVIINLDAYKDQVFEAKVSRILPQKDRRTRTFTVEARFINGPDKLYSGLSGEANIITNILDSTLVIPRSYLIDQNMVKTDDGFKTITIGRKNMEYVEVLSGIDSSTYLLQPE